MQCTAAKLWLRVVLSSGEPLQEPLLIQLQDALPAHATILNVYGCTEVSADATCFDATSWQRAAAADAACDCTLPATAVHHTAYPLQMHCLSTQLP